MIIHSAAATGFQAGAGVYAAGRPDYPENIKYWLKHRGRLEAGKIAVDLGSGTGKFIPYLQSTGARLIAVEPVANMLDRLAAAYPDTDPRLGTAENIPLDDHSADAVICAQSFHWFANQRALDEIRRVLKPGGWLGLIWNVRDETIGWVRALSGIIAPHENSTPRYSSGAWRSLFPAKGFDALKEQQFPYCHTGNAERVIVDRTLSTSFVAALPAEEREKLAGRIRQLIDQTVELARRDSVSYPYITKAFDCHTLK